MPIFNGYKKLIQENIQVKYTLNILYSHAKEHDDTITSLAGASMCDNFCNLCNRGFKHLSSHKCPVRCDKCKVESQCNRNEELVKCSKCLFDFYGHSCYENHMKAGSFDKKVSVCDAIKKCGTCSKLICMDQPKHTCGFYYCSVCACRRPYNHRCFMPKVKHNSAKPDAPPTHTFLFYDFETRQEKKHEDPGIPDTFHEVNFCVA